MSADEVRGVLWPSAASADGNVADAGGEVQSYAGASDLATRASALCEATRSRGAEWFGEMADNMAGVLVDMGHGALVTPVSSNAAQGASGAGGGSGAEGVVVYKQASELAV